MNITTKISFFRASTLATVSILVALAATPVMAMTATSDSGSSAATTAHITLIKTRADQEIARRLTALNNLATRIQAMQKVSASDKVTLANGIEAQIVQMDAIKTKIDADTDLPTLKIDVASITKSYRIFILIIPQGAITAAVDRIDTITGLMTTLGTNLQTRITQAQTAGDNVSALQTTLTDFNAKVTDANTQAQAALAEITNLVPDQGNQTVMQSNTAALKDARAKIKTATQDLQAARKDVGSIATALKGFKTPSPTPATPTTTNQ